MTDREPPTKTPALVWGADLDGRHDAWAQRTGHPYRGRLTLIDTRSQKMPINEPVPLSSGAPRTGHGRR